jgi:hypothetical protein
MTNNRIQIECRECDVRKCLLEFYPSEGWYIPKRSYIDEINDFLEKHYGFNHTISILEENNDSNRLTLE